MRDLSNYSLKPHNTFGIEARCRRFLEYSSTEEARQVANLLRQSDSPYIIIGGGSNLLLTGNFEGTVVHSAIKGIVPATGNRQRATDIRCGSGEVWDDVVEWTVSQGLRGAENLSLIPGDVGASAVQNIGAYGVEVSSLVERVEAVEIATGRACSMSRDDCQYGYRDSRFKHEWKDRYLITHVTYRLSPTAELNLEYGNIRAELERRGISEPSPKQLRQLIIDIRREKLPDPAVTGNAGSFFMNPVVGREKYLQLAGLYPDMPHYHIDEHHEKIPAAWLIDQCGWKGRQVGRAGVHPRQALVLVNLGGATGSEIVNLCRLIRQDVAKQFGIELRPEVNIV